jgi:C4-dicarboxylate-specific signal transduction histidine kinase
MTRTGHRLTSAWARVRNTLPALVACLLVALGLSLALRSEQQSVVVRADQVTVQARIMAAALAGALAFDDVAATREYLGALKLNPDVRAAAVYSRGGERVAGFTKDAAPFPRRVAPHPARVSNMMITVVEPVRQGSLDLGAVYIESSIEPLGIRLSRYVAIGLMIVFAALLIWLLGRSFARVAEANDKLRAEIIAREQAERALIQAQKMEALGHLTGGIAHDFNNLLMAASSGLELLQRSSDPVRQQKFTQGIKEALDRGARLTRQLLAFARHSPVNPEVVDVTERLRGIEDLLERSLRENIAIVYDLDQDLWPVHVDPVQFEVAIVNIAVNARDAMPHGGAIRISACNVAAPRTIDRAHHDRRRRVRHAARIVAKGVRPVLYDQTGGSGNGPGTEPGLRVRAFRRRPCRNRQHRKPGNDALALSAAQHANRQRAPCRVCTGRAAIGNSANGAGGRGRWAHC